MATSSESVSTSTKMALEMNDRLEQLRQLPVASARNDDLGEEETAFGSESKQTGVLGSVFNKVANITEKIEQIKQLTEEIEHYQNIILSTSRNSEAKKKLEKLVDKVRMVASKALTKVRGMKREVDSVREEDRNNANFRIKKDQMDQLYRLLREAMMDYNQVHNDYRNKMKQRIEKEIHHTGKTVSDEQIETLLEARNLNTFTQDILVDTDQKKQALEVLQEQHQQILKLEKNLQELHDIFMDLALLVEEQGELLNRIEEKVNSADDYIVPAVGDIEEAEQDEEKSSKLKCAICCVVTSSIVGLLIIAAIVVISVVCSTIGQC